MGKAGRAWWRWAWALPQAAGWSDGDLYALAHRATLEDDLADLGVADSLDLSELIEDPVRRRGVESLIRSLRRQCAGKLALERATVDIDAKFGLTAKGRQDLRWTIKPSDESEKGQHSQPASSPGVRLLRAVDPVVAEGR